MSLRFRSSSAAERRLRACCPILLAVLLHAGAVAPQVVADPPPTDQEGVARRLADHLRARGFEPWEDRDEQDRFSDWLLHAGAAAWDGLRSVAYREVYFIVGSELGSDQLQMDVSIHEVRVAYPTEGTAPPRFAAVSRFPVTRTGGYPVPGIGGGRTALVVLKAFDGRRLLAGQYPGMFFRASTGRDSRGGARREFHLIDGNYHLFPPSSGNPGGFAAWPQGADVLVIEEIHERDAARTRLLLEEKALAGALHPWAAVHRSRQRLDLPFALRLMMDDPERRPHLNWWRDEEEVVVLEVDPAAGRPSALLLVFSRDRGLPLEYSGVGMREGLWRGSRTSIDYVEVTSGEGERMVLPQRILKIQAPSEHFREALGLSAADLKAPEGEDCRYFDYELVNATELEGAEAFAFQAFAQRVGLRMTPAEKPTAAEMELPADTLIFGPSRMAGDYLARWDAANREALAASGFPVTPEDLIPLEQLFRDSLIRHPAVYRSYYLDEHGALVDLPPYGPLPDAE